MSAAGEETVTSSMDVPALTRQQALGPLFSRVMNAEDLAVLSVVLEQMDDLDDVARLRQTCRVRRDGVDACMKMKRMVAGERESWLGLWLGLGYMHEDIPWQLIAWTEKWTRDNPWATWVARGDMWRERPDMTRALSRCNLAAVRVGKKGRENLLHVASYYGHAGMVMLLLGCGVDKDKADDDGRTQLYIASQKGHLDVVRLLVEAGADKDKADNDGQTPLCIACKNGHLEIVRLLIEAGADNASALHKACIQNDVSAIQTVLISGVNVDTGTTSSVLTPLYIACMFGNENAVRLLVVAGADKDKASMWRQTPLYIARFEGHYEIAKLLVEAGADDNEDDDEDDDKDDDEDNTSCSIQ